ncbi:hypothetical protein C7440_0354 [Pusillimonas noertemannii]|uniref:Uncharacterized protein n=1 Tax=Pusillimonas noertemannii TaxID=305977 RepID=A0A2U1CQ09_9BURK|nr:hypothetical protein C7440_0354 [Pusillimonas noertemannii]
MHYAGTVKGGMPFGSTMYHIARARGDVPFSGPSTRAEFL